MRSIIGLLIAVFIAADGLFLYAWYRLRSTINVHTTANEQVSAQYPLPYKAVSFYTEDAVRIAGWYLSVPDPKGVVILLHGFAGSDGGKALMLPHADYLSRAGYSALLIDFRGAGSSDGDRSYLGTREWQDAAAAYMYAASLPENQGKKIGFMGVSMGASTAIIAVGKAGKGDFIIASAPYARYDALFSSQFSHESIPVAILAPFFRVAAFIELEENYTDYDPTKFMSQIQVPVLIISGKNDTEVTYDQGQELYELANDPKSIWLADTGHDVHLYHPEEYERRVKDFLASVTGL